MNNKKSYGVIAAVIGLMVGRIVIDGIDSPHVKFIVILLTFILIGILIFTQKNKMEKFQLKFAVINLLLISVAMVLAEISAILKENASNNHTSLSISLLALGVIIFVATLIYAGTFMRKYFPKK